MAKFTAGLFKKALKWLSRAVFVAAILCYGALLLSHLWVKVRIFRQPVFVHGKVTACDKTPENLLLRPDRPMAYALTEYWIEVTLPDGTTIERSNPTKKELGTPATVMTALGAKQHVWVGYERVDHLFWLWRAARTMPGPLVFLVILGLGVVGVGYQISTIRPTLVLHWQKLKSPPSEHWAQKLSMRLSAVEHLLFHLLLTGLWSLVLWLVYRQLELTPLDATIRQGVLILAFPLLAWVPVSWMVHQLAERVRSSAMEGQLLQAIRSAIFIAVAISAVLKMLSSNDADWFNPQYVAAAIWNVLLELFGLPNE